MNMLTQDSIKAALNREIAEEILVVAKLAVNGMDAESIAQILGSTRDEVDELFQSQDYKMFACLWVLNTHGFGVAMITRGMESSRLRLKGSVRESLTSAIRILF